MALSSLSAIKLHRGIDSADTSQDTSLTRFLRAATSAMRSYLKIYVGGFISANTLANPTVVTSIGHGLASGDIIYIAGSNCTPTIDGERTITRVTSDTFTIPVNVTVAGTAGNYTRKITEFLSGTGTNIIRLRQTPVISISALYEDTDGLFGQASDAFDSTTLLTSGTDYAIEFTQSGICKTGRVRRVNSYWPGRYQTDAGLLVANYESGGGNIKVTYKSGYDPIPDDIQFAIANVVSEMIEGVKQGGPLSSESLDYYSYTKAGIEESRSMISSYRSMLAPYKKAVI